MFFAEDAQPKAAAKFRVIIAKQRSRLAAVFCI
jgi:hypothetical protein